MGTVSCILGFTYDYGMKLAATLWLTVLYTVLEGAGFRAPTGKALVQSEFQLRTKCRQFPFLIKI